MKPEITGPIPNKMKPDTPSDFCDNTFCQEELNNKKKTIVTRRSIVKIMYFIF